MDATGVAQPQHIENSNNNSSSTSSNNNNNSSNDNTTTTNGNVVGVGATELAAVAEELSKTAAKVESVELALSGGGVYLGITDKDKLLHQLEVLQTKEAQLQKKELYLMAAAAAPATSIAAAAAAIGFIPGLTVAGNPLPLPVVANMAPHLHNNPAVILRNANGDPEAPAISNAMGTNQNHLPFQTTDAIDTNPHHLTPAPAPSDSSQPPPQPSHLPPPQLSQSDAPEPSPTPATPAPAPAPAPPPSLLQGHLPAPDLAPGPGTANVPENGVGNMSANGAQHRVAGDIMAGTGEMRGMLRPESSAAGGTGQHQHHADQDGVGRMGEQGGGHPGFVGVMGIVNCASVSHGIGMTGGGHATGEPNANGGGVDAGLSVFGDATLAPVKRRANKSLDGMEPESKRRSRLSAQCQHPGCTTARTFGREGDKHASFCSVHKHEGMVNIKGRRCNVPGCQHRPGFAMPGNKRGKYCATHKEHGMIDVVSRKCQSEGAICDRQPVYGWPGERATRCGTHKLERTLTNLTTGATRVEKMYDVRGKRCQEHGCMRQPGFGDPLRDKGPVRCNEHKLEGMTNVRKRRALDKIHKRQHHHHQQQQHHSVPVMDYDHHEPTLSHHGPGEIPQHHQTHGSALGSEGLHSPSSYGAAVPVPSSYVHAGRHHSPPRHSLMRPTLNSTPPMEVGAYPPYSSAPEGVSSNTLAATTAAGVSTAAVAAESSSAGISATGHHPDYGSGSTTSSDPATGMPSHHHEHERNHGHHTQPPNIPTNHQEHNQYQQQHHHHHHHEGAVLTHHNQQHHHTPTHYATDQPEHTQQPHHEHQIHHHEHQTHHHEHQPHHHEHQPHQSSPAHTVVHHHAPQAHSHQAPPPDSPPAHAPDHDTHPFYDEVAANSPNLGVPTSPLDGQGRHEGGAGGMVGEGGGHAAPEDEEHGEDVNVGDEGATLEALAQAAHGSSVTQH